MTVSFPVETGSGFCTNLTIVNCVVTWPLRKKKFLAPLDVSAAGRLLGVEKHSDRWEREPQSLERLGAPQRNSRCVFFDPAYNLCVARLLFGGDLMAISESISPPSLCMPTNQTGRVRFFLVSFLPLSLIPISRSAQTRFLSSLVYTRISIILKLVPVWLGPFV